MEDDVKQRLSNRDLWTRALFMVLFVFAYSIAELVITLIVIFQFFSVLFTGRANTPLLEFGANTSAYVYQILRFQTFNTETRPFPFSSWPEEEAGGSQWTQDESAADPESPARQENTDVSRDEEDTGPPRD